MIEPNCSRRSQAPFASHGLRSGSNTAAGRQTREHVFAGRTLAPVTQVLGRLGKLPVRIDDELVRDVQGMGPCPA